MSTPENLQKAFDLLHQPYVDDLLNLVGTIQKNLPPGYSDLREFMADFMDAVDLFDGGHLDIFLTQ